MSKYVCYTAILGDMPDKLQRPPETLMEGCNTEFIAFVDRDYEAGKLFGCEASRHNGWKLVWWPHELDGKPLDSRMEARRLKILAHQMEDVDYSLWIDGCLTPLTPMQELVDRFLANHDICVFEHMQRSTVGEELEACIRLKKDNPDVLREQVARYMHMGFLDDVGLAETTAVLRRHGEEMTEFNKAWWYEVNMASCRDQISFPFVSAFHDVPYATFEGTRTKSPHFKHRPHR